MNEQEIRQKAILAMAQNPDLRYGQAIYNVAYHIDNTVSDLAGSDYDPFYDNDNIEKFLEKICGVNNDNNS